MPNFHPVLMGTGTTSPEPTGSTYVSKWYTVSFVAAYRWWVFISVESIQRGMTIH